MSYYDAWKASGVQVPNAPPDISDWHKTIGLTDQNPDYKLDGSVREVAMGLGWDTGCDVDASCALFDGHYEMVDCCWFRNLRCAGGAVRHSGDDLTGEGGGDDEIIKVHLDGLPLRVSYLLFVVCVYTPGRDFSSVRRAYVRMMHGKAKHKNHVLCHYNLSKMYGNAMLMGLLSRQGAYWTFKALGNEASGRTIMNVVADPSNLSALHNTPSHPPIVRKITLTVCEGRGLAAKDKSLFSKKSSSDPFVKMKFKKNKVISDVIKKTLEPKWKSAKLGLGYVLESDHKAVKITVWDHDLMSHDFMGCLRIPVIALYSVGPGVHQWWMPLTKSKKSKYANCEVKGEILIEVSVEEVDTGVLQYTGLAAV